MRKSPSFLVYYPGWMFLALSPVGVALAPFQRTWQNALADLGFGIGSFLISLPILAYAAWWRDRYNEWQPEDRRMVDDTGYPVSRVELASDAFVTRVVNFVWPKFRADRDRL